MNPTSHRELAGRSLRWLTPRELDVLSLMADGWSNTAICERLFLSPKTVETHVRQIFLKLGLGHAPELNRRVLAVLAYSTCSPRHLELAA